MAQRTQASTRNPATTATDLYQLGGVGAVLGGGLLVLMALATATMPRGCIAEECAYRPMRESPFGAGAIFALLLITAGAALLVVRARRAGRLGRLGWTGLFVVAAGVILLATGVVVLGAWDSSLVPVFVISGGLALIAGFLLVDVAVFMAGVLPRWVAALLVAGTLVMLGFNDQTWRALLAVPFGVAWVAVGYVLWTIGGEASRQPTPVQQQENVP